MRQTRTPLLTRSKAVKSPDGLYPPPPSEAWGLPPSASQGPSAGSAGHSATATRGGGFRNGSFIMRSAGAAVSLHAGKSTSSEDDPNMYNNRRSIDKSTSSSSSSGSRPGLATNSIF